MEYVVVNPIDLDHYSISPEAVLKPKEGEPGYFLFYKDGDPVLHDGENQYWYPESTVKNWEEGGFILSREEIDLRNNASPIDKAWLTIEPYDPRHQQAAVIFYIEGAKSLYGWNHKGQWMTGYNPYIHLWKNGFKQSSPDDILLMMINEAKFVHRYAVGDKIKPFNSIHDDWVEIVDDSMTYHDRLHENLLMRDTLTMGDVIVYQRGVWGEIMLKAGQPTEEDRARENEKEGLTNMAALALLQGISSREGLIEADGYIDGIWVTARKFANAKYEKIDDTVPDNSGGMGSDEQERNYEVSEKTAADETGAG